MVLYMMMAQVLGIPAAARATAYTLISMRVTRGNSEEIAERVLFVSVY